MRYRILNYMFDNIECTFEKWIQFNLHTHFFFISFAFKHFDWSIWFRRSDCLHCFKNAAHKYFEVRCFYAESMERMSKEFHLIIWFLTEFLIKCLIKQVKRWFYFVSNVNILLLDLHRNNFQTNWQQWEVTCYNYRHKQSDAPSEASKWINCWIKDFL